MYLSADLQTYRVFFPTDIFLHAILGLPTYWQSDETMNALIDSIASNPSYRNARASFRYTCLSNTQRDNQLYNNHLKICDAVTQVMVERDILGASRRSSSSRQQPTNKGVENSGRSQGQLYYDVKAGKRVLDFGSTCSYTILGPGGLDPRDCELRQTITEPAEAQKGLLKDASCSPQNVRKRLFQSCPADLPVAKRFKSHILPAMAASVGQTPKAPTSQANDNLQDPDSVSLECAQYALEVLSSAGFRSHSLGMLFGLNEMQLLYYDRSIIAVSQPFRLVDLQTSQCESLDERRFIAVLICLHRATLAQRGILENLMPDPCLEMYKNLRAESRVKDPMSLFVGRKIRLQVGGEAVLVTLGRTVIQRTGIIGRNTCVVEGTSDAWPDRELVVKISWPSSSRVPENAFVGKITEAVKAEGDAAAWVLDHIPTILHSQDFSLQPDSPGTKLQAYLSGPDVKFVDNKAFHYEHRVCRVSVHERLYHLDALKRPKEYAQVIFDVLQVHRWIYDHPRIIHRDLSQGNIMWHRRRGRICGVLNNFDLSSSRDAIGASSKQRTGTRPFMAHELHQLAVNGQPPIHLYRHDLESIFYIIILLTCAHTLRKEPDHDGSYMRADKSSTFQSWFSMTDKQLYDRKCNVIANLSGVSIPGPARSFQGFTGWIQDMHARINEGVLDKAKAALKAAKLKAVAPPADEGEYDDETDDEMDQAKAAAPPAETDEDEDMDMAVDAVTAFDNETLDGAVSYDAILDIMKTFAKDGPKPRSLVVMYPIAKTE